jgi:hypothetical protein
MSIGRTELEYITRADERSNDLRGATVEVNGTDMVGGLVAGLAYGQPRIITGIVMGPVRIIVDRRDERPGETVDNWEDVVEVSLQAAGNDVVAAGPYADAPDAGLALNPPDAEWFRLRVHGRNRDLENDLVATRGIPFDDLAGSAVLPDRPQRRLRMRASTQHPEDTLLPVRSRRRRDESTTSP